MTKSRFEPVHDAHAIVEQMIFFEFTPTLHQSMRALITLKDDLASDFPSNEILKSVSVMIAGPSIGAGSSHQQVQEEAGLRLSRFKADGSIDMNISIQENNIVVSCSNYSSWKEIWPSQEKYIRAIFAKMSGSNSFLTGVGMKWLDQFIYDGLESEYDARDLLKTDSIHLNQKSFISGSRWHCHSGWFEPSYIGSHELLNQLNVDAGIVNISGNTKTAVTIDHVQVIRATMRVDELSAFAPGAPSLDALSGLMEALHNGNKRVLMDVLTDSIQSRIGLKPEQIG